MGLAGKILAVLNVLAAIAFATVAVLDYGARQAWILRVRQQEFVLRGLPLDENETDVEGRPLVQVMGKGMAERLFSGTGQVVSTQMQEVNRVADAVKARISGAEANKIPEMKAVLLPLARTWGERDELRHKIEAGRGDNADELVEAAFKPVREGSGQNPDERRAAIAHLLFNVAKSEEQQRVAVVVGLDSYVRAVDAETVALSAMLPQLVQDISDERTVFAGQHKAVLHEVLAMNERVQAATDLLLKQSAVQQQHDTLVKQRQKDIEEMHANIAAAQKATAAAFARQTQMENDVFATHRLIAETTETNQNLEAKIRDHERKPR